MGKKKGFSQVNLLTSAYDELVPEQSKIGEVKEIFNIFQ